MKLKSFLAIASCSAIGASLAVVISLSTSIPSIAETVKEEGYVQSESTGIENKDYRNKQSTPSIVGSWKSSVEDNEHRHTDPQEIYMDIKSDGTTAYAFQREDRADGFNNNTYKYSPTKDASVGAWVTKDINGTVYVSAIKWISKDEFVLTLIKDSHEPYRNGLQRKFIRINEPVATQLQQQAQAAARTQRPTTADYTDYNRTVNFGRQLPGALDSIKFNP